MTGKMLPKDTELYRRIEEVVHYVWDPIGICQHPQARDEYSSYMTAIYGNVKAGDLNSLVTYMKWVIGNMGLSFEQDKVTEVAQVMLKWKQFIEEKKT